MYWPILENLGKTCWIIQPGAFGDILITAPIAHKYNSTGFTVKWPARQKYHKILRKLPYIQPVLLDEEELDPDWLRSDVIKSLRLPNPEDKILNLADRGPHPTAERSDENFEQCKYRLSNVDFKYKHLLHWKRDTIKEDEIYNKYVTSTPYAFVHNTSSHEERAYFPDPGMPVVMCEDPPGYDIFDWYKVVLNASKIYCTESIVWAFIDGLNPDRVTKDKYLLSRAGLSGGKSYTISSTWKRDYLL